MVAQPLLEAHYSLHGAFLERPLLEVRVVLRSSACYPSTSAKHTSFIACVHLPLCPDQLAHFCWSKQATSASRVLDCQPSNRRVGAANISSHVSLSPLR